jgi:large subunit ribosomal protein L18
MAGKSLKTRDRRRRRIRMKISGTPERPRLSVFRSTDQVYAQLIDDVSGQTLVSASSIDKELKAQMEGKTKSEQATLVGKAMAERALATGIEQVVFDRGGFLYHGRIKALADGARESGLKF